MLYYLTGSETRAKLLELLWVQGRKGSMHELAEQCGLSSTGVQRELPLMEDAGFARSERAGNARVFSANLNYPAAKELTLFLKAVQKAPEQRRRIQKARDEQLRKALQALGAPLLLQSNGGREKKSMPLEETLAGALELSRRDPTVARVMPMTLWKQRNSLDLRYLVSLAGQRNQKQALGLFLDLAQRLENRFGQKKDLWGEALEELRDHRRRTVHAFFENQKEGRFGKQLAERNTPKLARKWLFTMNMTYESFEDVFKKTCVQ